MLLLLVEGVWVMEQWPKFMSIKPRPNPDVNSSTVLRDTACSGSSCIILPAIDAGRPLVRFAWSSQSRIHTPSPIHEAPRPIRFIFSSLSRF